MANPPTIHDSVLARIQRTIEQGGRPIETLTKITSEIIHYHYAGVSRWLHTGDAAVRTGPLAGLRYLPESSGSLYPPKLVGCYESELHKTIERIVASPYKQVMDVGCAEGYYAVGLAMQMPKIQVFAFDLDARARDLCRQMAELNDVSGRVNIEETCTHQRLEELAGPGTLVFCDIEGAETELLDPEKAQVLAKCDIVVECHDFLGTAHSQILAERFQGTHDVEVIENTWVNPNSVPFLRGLKPIQKFLAVWEGRPGLSPWLFMTARKPKRRGGRPKKEK